MKGKDTQFIVFVLLLKLKIQSFTPEKNSPDEWTRNTNASNQGFQAIQLL
jgi:hypothetical protein